jgi:predicted nucleic acid-binding protein
MTSWTVTDASLLLATVLEENHSDRATRLFDQFIQQQQQLAAPRLLRYELVSVVRKSVYSDLITVDEAQIALDTLFEKRVRLFFNEALLRRAYAFATQFNRPAVYDSQYLAVAEFLGCDFWTVDERFYNTVGPTLSWVKWIGELT